MRRPALLARHGVALVVVVLASGARVQASLPWLHQEGIFWANDEGQKVDLKGVNLGNWLILEMWMTNLFEGVHDQCTLEAALTAQFGYAGKESVMRTWRDNWITARDLNICQAAGFNCVRVPFLYAIIEDENNPYTVRADAWDHLDWVINEAEARGMYTILDLHGAVGGQSDMDHTGCSNQNLLWSTPDYQSRTIWLWQQIATRYQNRSAVAAYDLLNEAWGTDCTTMAQFEIDLYNAIRPIDPNHCIILSSAITCGGIDMYGDPQDDHGMVNVAFTHHFYPGFFGNGDATVTTHADWLACRNGASSGICEWIEKIVDTGTAFLVGELQPWASLGGVGGELTRHTYDRYAELGMATTSWAYKVLTENGGQGNGTWGIVTNVRGSLSVASNTWSCPGWNGAFDASCVANHGQYEASGTGPYTLYLVLKNGALSSNSFDIVWDEISFVHDATSQDLVTNGGFGSGAGWTAYTHEGVVNRNYGYTGLNPTGGSPPALRMFGTASSSQLANGGVYQAITVVGGETYTLSGTYRDLGSSDSWAEVYLTTDPPVNGLDLVNTGRLPDIDISTWSQSQIESYLQSLATMEYDVHDDVLYWLTTAEKPCLIAELCDPICGDGNCDSGEDACSCSQDCAGVCTPGQPFAALPAGIPGRVEAESFDLGGELVAYHDCDAANTGGAYRPSDGVDIEVCSEGGYNVGWICDSEWIDYTVEVTLPGVYEIAARIASEETGGTFHIEFDRTDVSGAMLAPATGGWQTWESVGAVVTLSTGVQTMRFVNDGPPGQEYNLNYFDITLLYPVGDIDYDGDVDLDDYAIFGGCLLGPGATVPAGGCAQEVFDRSDLDGDGDLDLQDFAIFQRLLVQQRGCHSPFQPTVMISLP